MINQELLFYIKDQLRAGYPKEAIRDMLVTRGGWQAKDVDEVFAYIVSPKENTLTPTTQTQFVATPAVSAAPLSIDPVASPTAATEPNKPVDTRSIDMSFYQPTRATTPPMYEGMNHGQGSVAVAVGAPAKRRNRSAVVGVMLLILSLGGGVTYGYTQYWNPAPEQVIGRMLGRLSTMQSAKYTSTITASFPGVDGALASVGLVRADTAPVGMPTQKGTTMTLELSGDIRRDGQGVAGNSTGQVSLTDSMGKVGGAFTGIFKDETIFMKVPNGLPADFAQLVAGAGLIPGDTVSVNPGDVLNVSGQSSTWSLTGSPAEFFAMLIDRNAVSLAGKLPDTSLNGSRVHHYQFSISRDAIAEILSTIVRKNGAVTSADVQDMLKGIDFQEGEVWIGSYDFLPHQVSFSIRAGDPLSPTRISVVIGMSDFDSAVSVIIPTDAKSLSLAVDSARGTIQTSMVKNTLAQVRAVAEIYYSTKRSYAGLCKSPIGLLPIMTSLSTENAPASACFDTAKGYAIGSSVAGTTPAYFCVDNSSTGEVHDVAALPTKAVCE